MRPNDQQGASGNVQLSVALTPGRTHAQGLAEKSASRASELLNLNHNLYHTRFNGGFHNHITHHLLALWALGASPDELQDMWYFNKPYQAPIEQHETPICKDLDLKDPVIFDRCLGKDEYYADFMRFFENEVGERGVPDVIKEYVLKGDARANDIFCRMYTDLVHPIIHLGYAIEFKQPSLVAEALAAACVHDDWPKDFLLPTEGFVQPDTPSKSLLQIFDIIRHDPDFTSAVKDTDPFNKVRDGLLKRVTGEQLAPYLSQFQVKPTLDDMQRKLTEMMHTSAYMMGAAQRPGNLEELGETVSGFPIAKSDFVKIAHMAVDSVERAFEPQGHSMPEAVADAVIKQVGQGGEMVVTNMVRWVFYGGLEKAWQYVPDSKRTANQSA
ncbi:cytochrome P450 monooxygenase [Physcia stellaris]|nr:cytochrome P450 monooxygenase [Physcia stellaris]